MNRNEYMHDIMLLKSFINKSISSNGKENNHHRYNFTYIEYSKSIRYVIIILRGYYCKNKKNI